MRSDIRTTSGGLMLTQMAVEDLLTRSQSAFSSRNDQNGTLGFLDEQINNLKQILKETLSVEKEFYKILNIDNTNYQSALKELQKRIDQINENTGLGKLVNNPYPIIKKFAQYFDSVSTDTVLAALNDSEIARGIAESFLKDPKQNPVEGLIDSLNIKLNTLIAPDEKTKTFFHVRQKGRGEVNLAKKLIFNYDPKTRSITFSIKEGMTLDNETKNKILKAVNSTQNDLSKGGSFSLKNFYEDVWQEIKNVLKDTEAEEYAHQEYERTAKNAFKDYFLNRNESVLKGLLAEINNTLVLNLLLGQPGKIIPTGNIKTLMQGVKLGQSISIDAVFKSFHFQIKGYKLENDSDIEFSGQNQAGYFIRERAEISGSVGDLLVQLFGSYQFNQPFKNKEIGNYMDTYSKFGQVLANSQKVFQAYVNNIIHLSATFQADKTTNLFQNKQLYINHFFNIHGKFIPASAIIQGIIDSLSAKRFSQNVTFNILGIDRNSNNYTLDQVRRLENKYTESIWRKDILYNARDMADQVKIRWRVQLKLNEVLENAYKRVAFA